jgi:hypothetical protein
MVAQNTKSHVLDVVQQKENLHGPYMRDWKSAPYLLVAWKRKGLQIAVSVKNCLVKYSINVSILP